MIKNSPGPANLQGLSVSKTPPHVSVRSRLFWFVLGLGVAFTVAGLLGGRCP